MDIGRGKGYRNVIGKDPKVHGDSARGRKQPQRIPYIQTRIDQNADVVLNVDDLSWDEIEKRFGKLTIDDYEITGLMPSTIGGDVTVGLDEYGNVTYPNGLASAIEEVGGRILSDKEIKKIFKQEIKGADGDVWDALNEFETDNTYNFSPALAETYNYGYAEKDGKIYFIFRTHLGGDVRGNYSDHEVVDITDIDTGATGEPQGDMIGLLNPEVYIDGNFKGKQATYRYMGGGGGFDYDSSEYPDILSDLWDKYEQFAQEQSTT